MHPRIKEIALQSGFPEWWIDPIEPERQNSEAAKMLEKFAELVVLECCGIVNDRTQVNNPNDCLTVLEVKEHFGMEDQ